MNRLIAFGCSNTYGHGLSDCIDPPFNPGPEPSKYAWPSHLAKLLNLNLVNKSICGASNFEILYNILNFKFEPTDSVIILWTTFARDLLFLNNSELPKYPLLKPIGTWMTKEKNGIDIKPWLMLYNSYDLIIRSLFHIHHAENYLENLNLKNKSFVIDNTLISNIPNFFKFKNIETTYLRDILLYDKALDGNHPGPIAHKKLAELFFNFYDNN
jgi:hypothetical protein